MRKKGEMEFCSVVQLPGGGNASHPVERLPLSGVFWFHRTRDLFVLCCPISALVPVSRDGLLLVLAQNAGTLPDPQEGHTTSSYWAEGSTPFSSLAFWKKSSSDGYFSRSLHQGSGQVQSSVLIWKQTFSHQNHTQAGMSCYKSGAILVE